MKVVVLGSGGQLGQELQRTIPAGVRVVAWDYPEIDLAEVPAIVGRLQAEEPSVIINAAAYTAVDLAESETEKAHSINAVAPLQLAEAAKAMHARFLHVSTDFVFDGTKSRPYLPLDATNPVSVYGSTKLEGEDAVLRVLGEKGVVVRTSWLYSSHGKNFALTMLRLLRERGTVRVVADQVGSPTWARTLADVLWRLASRPELHGLWHYCDAGVASWYDFAHAIAEEAHRVGVLPRAGTVLPIATEEYPTPARRPSYSVLDSSATRQALGLEPLHWREGLRAMIEELQKTHA